MSTPAVDRAYYAAQRADDRFQAALDKAGLARYSTKYPPAIMRLKKAKIRADERYHDAVQKMRANPSWRRTVKQAKKGRRAIGITGKFPSRQKQLWKRDQMAKRKKNPTRKRGLNLNPLRKVMKEAGTKKVRVMRSKSGKPTGVKFL